MAHLIICSKPIDDEMLAECLNRLMEQHRTERKEALLSGRDMATVIF